MNQYYTEKQQARYVDDAMRQARVQARKAQQTGAAVPSVKGIRESVVQPVQPVQPAAPAVPAQSAAPLTASAPSVPRAPSTPSTLTTPKVTSTPRAASIPRVTPTAPAVNSSASGLSGLTGLTGNTGASGLLGSAGTHPQTGSYAQNANTDPLYIGRPKITNDIWGTNVPAAYSPLQTPAPAKASASKTAQPNFTTSAAGAILKVPEAQPSAGLYPAEAPTPAVTVNTAPVSNRSRAEAEENTPDLALSARKLADMRSLYREFSPTLQAALEYEYKNDPTGLRVIRGELSADDWLKEKLDARTAVAARRKAQTAQQLALDPTVQADARRSGEILITSGVGKAVTQNTQPAYYSAEMFRADSHRAKIAAERQNLYYAAAMTDPIAAAAMKYGNEIVLPSGQKISPELQILLITNAAEAYGEVANWISLGGELSTKIGSDLVKRRKLPAVGYGKKAVQRSIRKTAAILDDVGEAMPQWLDAAGMVFNAIAGIEQNYAVYGSQVSDEKLCWDITVDLFLDGVTSLSATAIGALVGSCLNPGAGSVIGAIIGALVEEFYFETVIDENEMNGQTLREWMKGWVK